MTGPLSLERRIASLEEQVRSMRAGNLLNQASATATGGTSVAVATMAQAALDGATQAWVTSFFAGQIKVGGPTVTTDASGNFTITHNLGTVPTALGCWGRTAGSFGGHVFAFTSQTATTFTARAYYNNAANVSVSLPIFWVVFA